MCMLLFKSCVVYYSLYPANYILCRIMLKEVDGCNLAITTIVVFFLLIARVFLMYFCQNWDFSGDWFYLVMLHFMVLAVLLLI